MTLCVITSATFGVAGYCFQLYAFVYVIEIIPKVIGRFS